MTDTGGFLSKLDRRIATEIMREPKPTPYNEDSDPGGVVGILVSGVSKGGNWRVIRRYENGDAPEWEPQPFSAQMAQAQRAIDAYVGRLGGTRWVALNYTPGEDPPWEAFFDGEAMWGNSAPEAICQLLVRLVDRSRP